MKTASKILEEKGYWINEINEIVSSDEDSLDIQTREKFGLDSEPVQLWEKYQIGDADEEELNRIAKEQGFEDYEELLLAADYYLRNLADDYPEHPNKLERLEEERMY